jgi:hypothetical protein
VLDLFPSGDEADDVTGVSLMKAAYSQETPSSPEVNQLFARLTEVNNLTLHQVKTYRTYVGSNTVSVKAADFAQDNEYRYPDSYLRTVPYPVRMAYRFFVRAFEGLLGPVYFSRAFAPSYCVLTCQD